jgi:putative membrane protein
MQFFRFLMMGLAIGIVDLIPGVSGGTLAFAFGIWERIIASIAATVSAIRSVFRLEISASWAILKSLEWSLLIPLGLGMLTAIVVGASVIGMFIENHPSYLRAFFLGILLGVISLPLGRIERWTPVLVFLFLSGAIISFYFAGLPQQSAHHPPLIIIFMIGAITICATILPGLSGSFLLMIFGVYEVFIDSVREREVAIWASFALGALTGTLLFSAFLKWILARYRDIVLASLLGLTIGAVRILWPWLGTERELLAPDDLFNTGCWLVAGVCIAFLMRKIISNSEPETQTQ